MMSSSTQAALHSFLAGFGWTSDAVPGRPNFGQKIADNFILNANASISTVTWAGGSEFTWTNQLTNIASFTVEFWTTDSASPAAPATLIYSEVFPWVSLTPTVIDNTVPAWIYELTANLATPVNLNGSTEYWLSVGATLIDMERDGFIWNASPWVDGALAVDTWDGNGWQGFNNGMPLDAAFALYAIPEPSSFLLFCFASLAGLGIRRRT